MKIVVLENSTFHLGYLGCYGNDWIVTPTLDRLAAEGVVFDQHFADGSAGEFRSGWTGLHCFPMPPGCGAAAEPGISFVQVLKDHGVPVIHHRDLAATDTDQDRDLGARLEFAFSMAQEALEQLADQSQGLVWVDLPALAPPWLVSAEVLETYLYPEDESDNESESELPWPDPPSVVPETEDDTAFCRLQNTYAAVVTLLDTLLGEFLKELEERGTLDDFLLVFTSQCGLALGEHGFIGNSNPRQHEELLHIPLMLRLPNAEHGGRRVPALTQPLDLVPTLFELFQIPRPHCHGLSILPLLQGETPTKRSYVCSGMVFQGEIEWALRTAEWSYALPVVPAADKLLGESRLFVRPDDRWERNDIVRHHPVLAENLEKALREFVAATARPGTLIVPELLDEATQRADSKLDVQSFVESGETG